MARKKVSQVHSQENPVTLSKQEFEELQRLQSALFGLQEFLEFIADTGSNVGASAVFDCLRLPVDGLTELVDNVREREDGAR